MILAQFLKSIPDLPLPGIKEYSIEKEEWFIMLVFVAWVYSYACLWRSFPFRIRSLKVKFSLTLLLISSIGLIIAGVLNMNPIPPCK